VKRIAHLAADVLPRQGEDSTRGLSLATLTQFDAFSNAHHRGVGCFGRSASHDGNANFDNRPYAAVLCQPCGLRQSVFPRAGCHAVWTANKLTDRRDKVACALGQGPTES
jgi:hypothetical protein